MKPISNNWIAFGALVLGFSLTIFIFAESRNDPGLRMAALVSGTGTVATLLAIASTLLTGKDLSKHDPPDPPQPPTGGQ